MILVKTSNAIAIGEKVSIGARLKEERNRIGLIQADAAKAAGVGFTAYQGYERGDRFPNAESLYGLFLVGFDVLYVVTGTRNNSTLSNEQSSLLGLYGQIDERLRPVAIADLQALADAKL